MEMGFVKRDDDAKIEEGIKKQYDQCAETALHLPIPTPESTETEDVHIWSGVSNSNTVSISMPATPIGHAPRRTSFADSSNASSDRERGLRNFYSQSMSKSVAHIETSDGVMDKNIPIGNPALSALRDNRFDSFKTWSGKLERQLSHLRGKPVEEGPHEHKHPHGTHEESMPVGRYFAALEGPELDTLRASEELMLPKDRKWPFLLRYPITSFGMCLGVSSQAILWKNLATSPSTSFLHVSPIVNMVLWCIAIVLVVIVSFIYALKLIFYFEAVRREYYHPIRVNFFFAPFIALLFLALGVPPSYTKHLHHSLWYVLMTPFVILELKIYGQWMSGGQRRLSKVANPSNHIAIVGNFVGALLGASMGLKEGPIFFFAVGLAHYIVLFVTLYQRLPTNDTLPKELHPVFFLFVAAPNVASLAWAKINGSFDNGARLGYFIALFLYFSLVVRINFFRGFKFSIAWWAYTFPMTGAAIATIKYTEEVTNWVTRSLVVTLSGVATLVVMGLLVTTLIHAFVLGDLFPNDIAIAISDVSPPKPTRKRWLRLRNGILQSKDNESYLKFGCFQNNKGVDLEASVGTSSTDGQY